MLNINHYNKSPISNKIKNSIKLPSISKISWNSSNY